MENKITIPTTEKEWRSLTDEQTHELFNSMELKEKLNVLKTAPKMYRLIGYYDQITRAEVMQRYMNATTTYYGAMGHKKAESNKWIADSYKSLMEENDIPVPNNDICFVLGKFNGEGSY
jgi:hypothetical protein